ncbi:MAG TPA: Snf7 family protein [Nitrososphaeraceae archaeon]|nr:Snf7 family protein [Nitrososphaeraceae archaeon]
MQHNSEFQIDLSNAAQVISNQITKLNKLSKKFDMMDIDFKKQIVQNIKVGNNVRAKALANELVNIHRIKQTTKNMVMSLEVVALRSSIIGEFAVIINTINPTIDLIKDIEKDISTVIPRANEMLKDVTNASSEILNYNVNTEVKMTIPVDDDALKILSEVEQNVEEETRQKLPDIPATINVTKNRNDFESLVEENEVMI